MDWSKKPAKIRTETQHAQNRENKGLAALPRSTGDGGWEKTERRELDDAWRDPWGYLDHGKEGITDDDVMLSHVHYPHVVRITTILVQRQDTLHMITNIHTINKMFYI